MKIINGAYANAAIFTDDIESHAEAQVKLICDQEAARGSSICLMPDIHPGKVGPIGLSMTVTGQVLPQLLGVDIGCGITCIKLNRQKAEFQKLDAIIRQQIPAGFAIRKDVHPMALEFPYEALRCFRHIQEDKALLSLGTLGGGNHFIELDKGPDGSLYLIIHTGSRHLGQETAEYYTKLASKKLRKQGKNIPYFLSYLEGDDKNAYLEDAALLWQYAELNRQIIAREILKAMKWKATDQFSVAHNYLDAFGVLCKGAISAREGERVIIPVNMRDGVILGIGKGNAAWNFSAPHGSGRRLKRTDVKSRHTVSEFKKEMKGIYSTCIGSDTLDEAPFAYRAVDDILKQIGDTVEVTEVLKSVYSFKAGNRN